MEIHNTINRFANCFDEKDWDGLRNILAETVDCNYQDLRKNSGSMSCGEYVALRQSSLQTLKTQHLFSNHEVKIDGNKATCKCSAFISRRNDKGVSFDTHAIYHFGLENSNGGWRICSIKQSVLWNDGDAGIHAGVA